jgi:enamine deaminase RidA (YjgF/YER057c/UK114 family)
MKKIIFDKTCAEIASFTTADSEVAEHHVMIHVTDHRLPYSSQLKAVDDTLTQLVHGQLGGAKPVFKRYFLSDAYNQSGEVLSLELDYSDYALSVIQQSPLDGTKIALWVYLQTHVETRALPSGLYEVRHGSYRHLWNASAHNLAKNSEYQTRLLLNEYIMQLAQEGCRLADNCIRTWFFVNDVDNNYPGVVKARNQVFFTQDLTDDTHFIASTGIGGRQADPKVLSQMDNYAIDGLQPGQVSYLYAAHRLNRTSDYGVSFERGTRVDYGDRRHVFISGTASINNKGEIVHPGDVAAQTRHMWGNVEALLGEAGCTYDDVMQMIVYLRDIADYDTVRQLYDERFPHTPRVIVLAPVCRSGWLVEMECMAIRSQAARQFPAY